MTFLNTITQGDCYELIPKLPDKSIDLVITSPPYNVGLQGYDCFNDKMGHKNYIKWLRGVFKEIYPKLRKGGRVCLEGNTFITTNKGFKKIKDIIVGDMVLTHKGLWKKVTETMSSYHKSYYLVQSENSPEIAITGNHPILASKTKLCPYRETKNKNSLSYTCRKNCPHKNNPWRKKDTKIPCPFKYYKNYFYDFIKTEDLNKDDNILMPLPKYLNGKKRISKNLALIIGLYLSEGWVNKKRASLSVHFAFHKKEIPIHNLLKKSLKEEFNFICGKDYTRKNCTTINAYNTKFGKYIINFGKGARNKKIPENVLNNINHKDLLNIIVAEWLGDGSIIKIKRASKKGKNYGTVVSIATTSKLLAVQIRDILYKNGYYPRIVYTKLDSFQITLSGKDAFNFYIYVKKISGLDMYNLKNKGETKSKTCRDTFSGFVTYKIKKIKKINLTKKKKFYNIEVGDDHSYCLTNLVVHNCINIGDGENGKVHTHSDIIQFMCHSLHYLQFTTIVWEKQNTSNRMAWGSFKSPKNLSFPTALEYILIFAKNTYNLQSKGETDLTREEFVEWSLIPWNFSKTAYKESTRLINSGIHPAPFPRELPRRLIKMLSWVEATVLDPFIGSGTTAEECKRLGRNYIGFDISDKYVDYANKRLEHIITEESLFTENE